MMSLSSQWSLILAVALLSSRVSAYWLDPDSCASNLIVEDVVYSNVMARIGNQHLQAIAEGKGNPDVTKLAKLVLGEDYRPVAAAADRFSSLLSSDVMIQNTEPDTVKVYCNTDHLEVDDSGLKSYDRINDIPHDDNVFEKCKDSHYTSKPIKAVTHRKFDREGNEKLSTIHLCPWYLSAMVNDEIHGLGHWLTRLNDGAEVDVQPTLDSVNYLDATMLREFFRTAEGGFAQDVDHTDSYGWTNVRGIAQRNSGGRNAESLVYFAIGATLIEEQGWVVREDGTFGKRPTYEPEVQGSLLKQIFWTS